MQNVIPAAGSEVVDLRDELRMTDAEARSWLDAEPSVVTPDLAKLSGFTPDYQWLGWLADVLRAADLPVVEYAGWETRGRPRSVGPFVPEVVMWHHDGSAKGPSPALARFIAEEGRPAEGIPAPLSHAWVCAGCNGRHPVGTWHVLAAGRANHAGEGSGWGPIGEDRGNTQALGVETDNTVGEPTPWALYQSLVTGTAAILPRLGQVGPKTCGHKEYAAGRKTDPDDVDMDQAREDVAEQLRKPLKSYPDHAHFTVGHECKNGAVKQLENWLLELRANAKSKHEASREFSRWTLSRVRAFQRAHGLEDTGKVTRETWRLVQAAAREGRR